jgi:predicted RNA binding protein YcfA (HicA-like mRNA interferase family)
MAKTVSGKIVVKILCREFGFYFVSQKGSHVKLAKQVPEGKIITIVPMHRELAYGTFKSILELAQIEEDQFRSKL